MQKHRKYKKIRIKNSKNRFLLVPQSHGELH
jgi:hypothetical protein